MTQIPQLPVSTIMNLVLKLNCLKNYPNIASSIPTDVFYINSLITTYQAQLSSALKTSMTQLLAALYPNPQNYTSTQIAQFSTNLSYLIQSELANSIAISNPIYPPIILSLLNQQSTQKALSSLNALSTSINNSGSPTSAYESSIVAGEIAKQQTALTTINKTITSQVNTLAQATSTAPTTVSQIANNVLNYINNDLPSLYQTYLYYSVAQTESASNNILGSFLQAPMAKAEANYTTLLSQAAANRLLELLLFPNSPLNYTPTQMPIILQGIIIPCLTYKLQYIQTTYPS